jgi:hypothetical protein
MLWPSQERAALLLEAASTYRSGAKRRRPGNPEAFTTPQIRESLILLKQNGYTTLQNSRTTHIRGTISWARLANACGHGIAKLLLHIDSDNALDDATTFAREMVERLDSRDASKHARVTMETRDIITLVGKTGMILEELVRVRDGGDATDQSAGRATQLRQLYNRLNPLGIVRVNTYIRELVRNATSKVLASPTASGYVTSMYTRTAQMWLPATESRAAQEPRGEQVSWTDDEDDF